MNYANLLLQFLFCNLEEIKVPPSQVQIEEKSNNKHQSLFIPLFFLHSFKLYPKLVKLTAIISCPRIFHVHMYIFELNLLFFLYFLRDRSKYCGKSRHKFIW